MRAYDEDYRYRDSRSRQEKSTLVDIAMDFPEQRRSRHTGCAGENDTFAVEQPPRQLPGWPGPCLILNWSRKDFISGHDRVRSPRGASLSLSLSRAGKDPDLKNLQVRLLRRTVDGITAERPRHHPPFGRLLPRPLSFSSLSRGVR